MDADVRKTLACAIYTRKSSEEGLEQEFNSLDAQREACEAYVQSQRHEGWRAVPTLYDDGGFSGGNMDRPALARLMGDIRARKVDVVVVYKVDRLTRSLADFAKIVEVFDAQGVSFVSVTQQFNTTTSMGRLTLNVLLSFAQFEREVTGERIRDKIAASKKKGMFMGGGYPLGYDLQDHKLVVNEREAESIRTIFNLYTEVRSVRRLQAEIVSLGINSKIRTSEFGRRWGGEKIARGNLYYILRNRTYLGEILHKGQIYVGQHAAIVDRGLWDRVQQILAGNARERSSGERCAHPSPLAGFLFDDRGNRLTPSHTQRGSVRHRYYVCQALIQHQPQLVGAIKRIPAVEIEELVERQVRELLKSHLRLTENWFGEEPSGDEKQTVITAAIKTVARLNREGNKAWLAFARSVICKIVAGEEALAITFDRAGLSLRMGLTSKDAAVESQLNLSRACREGEFTVTAAVRLTRSGRNKRMIIADDSGARRLVNDGMVMAIARAVTWDHETRRGVSLRQIAKRENLSATYVTRIMPLAFLAPDIVQAIYEGRQPADLKVKALSANLPIAWVDQRRALGFPAR